MRIENVKVNASGTRSVDRLQHRDRYCGARGRCCGGLLDHCLLRDPRGLSTYGLRPCLLQLHDHLSLSPSCLRCHAGFCCANDCGRDFRCGCAILLPKWQKERKRR